MLLNLVPKGDDISSQSTTDEFEQCLGRVCSLSRLFQRFVD